MTQKLYYAIKENKELELCELLVTDADHFDQTKTLGGLSNETIVELIDNDLSMTTMGHFTDRVTRDEILATLSDIESDGEVKFVSEPLLANSGGIVFEVYYVVEEMPDDDMDSRIVTVVPKEFFDAHGALNDEFNLYIEAVLEHLNIGRLAESIFESEATADEIRLSLGKTPYIKFIESPELLAFLKSFAQGGN